MSRKFDRTAQINARVREIFRNPVAMDYIRSRVIRKKPRYIPLFLWKLILLWIIAPNNK